MKLFTRLYRQLENQSDPIRQQELVKSYFEMTDAEDAKWALYLLQNNSIKRLRSVAELSKIAQTLIDFSDEIFAVCVNTATDLLETISLSIPVSDTPEDVSLHLMINRLIEAKKLTKGEQTDFIRSSWSRLRIDERHIFNRLLTNSLKSPISELVLYRALGQLYNRSIHEVSLHLYSASRMSTTPCSLVSIKEATTDPLLLPANLMESSLLESTQQIQDPKNYTLSCEWNGVRVQIVKGIDDFHIWSRRGELLSHKFPEFNKPLESLSPGTILDGLLIAQQNDVLLPKSIVRKRIQRKRATPKLIHDMPVIFCAIDALRINKNDLTNKSFIERQFLLEKLIREIPDNNLIQLSDEIEIDKWDDLNRVFAEIKPLHSHAVIIKEKNKPYHADTTWFKVKGQHTQVKGVLLYAKRGEGPLSNQLVEFTLAAQSENTLVPFARVPITFMDDDNLRIKAFVKDHTLERFGPVYSLEAKLVFEISFESIEISKRHKCGFVLKKINFIKWHRDDDLEDIVELDDLMAMLEQ